MYRIIVTGLTVLVLATAANAQAFAVAFDAKRLASIRDVKHNWETDYGSFDRDFSQHITVAIQMRNMHSGKTNATLEVYFVAKDMTSETRWVFDKSLENVEIDSAKELHLLKQSKPLAASVQNYAALGIKDSSGGTMDGYIIRLVSGGKAQRVAASSRLLDTVGHDDVRLQKWIKVGEEAER